MKPKFADAFYFIPGCYVGSFLAECFSRNANYNNAFETATYVSFAYLFILSIWMIYDRKK